LRDAVRESRNFASELMMVKAFSEDNPEVEANIKIIEKYERGTASISSLKEDFDPVSESIIKLSRIQKENPNFVDKTVLRFSKIVQVRKIDSQGSNPEDIIARAYNYLQKNDLEAAVKEVNKLPEDAKALAKDWLERAEANIAAREAAEKIFLSSARPDIHN
jgi:hypothetical protein